MKGMNLTINPWIKSSAGIIVTIIVILLLLKQCEEIKTLKAQRDVSELNQRALKDTIRTERTEFGNERFLKNSLLTSNDDLRSLNSDLSDEVKKLKGKVLIVTKLVTVIKTDTHYVNNKLNSYASNKYGLSWKYDTTFSVNNYRKLSGESFFRIDTTNNNVIPLNTRIDKDEIGISMVTGIREKNNNLEIFVEPRYPNMKVTDIQGAVIDPQKSDVLKKMFPVKKWSVGPYLGVGVSVGKTILIPSVSFGVSIQRALIKF
jgi:hypothetical protein